MLSTEVRVSWLQRPLWQSAALVHIAVRVVALPGVALLLTLDRPRSFLKWLSITDGYWYRQIAAHGYSNDLVLDPATGHLARPTAIAFYPVYPFSVRAVTAVTRLPFSVAGPLVAFLFGLAGSIVLAHLVRTAAPDAVTRRPALPLIAVAAVNAFPTGAVLAFAYTEGVALLLISATLLLIVRRRYWWALIPVVALGFTRAVALPMAAVVLWHAVSRWRRERPSTNERVALGTLLVVAVASGFAWPLVAGVVTGRSDAFLLAQRYYRDQQDPSVPFNGVRFRLDAHLPGPVSVVVIALVVAGILLLARTRPVRELGPELQAWGAAYLVYLVAVSDLDGSGMRFLLLAITPAIVLVTWWRRRAIGYAVLCLMLVGQYLWLYGIWGDGFGLHVSP